MANLHPIGKMEFYRGLDMLKVKLSCIKHPKNKGLLTILKEDWKIVNKKSKKLKSVNHKMHGYHGVGYCVFVCKQMCVKNKNKI